MSTLKLERHGPVARLTLDRPRLHNAFDDELIAELTAALEAVAADAELRYVVLTGAGASFSAGADLAWMRRMAEASAEENERDALALARLMRTLHFLPKPVIARVQGSAYGGGVGLVACCDLAVAADHAKFALSEVRLGLVPAVISPYVVAAIGPRHAKRLFLTGEPIEAAEAERIGLVHRAVPAHDLDAEIERLLHWLGKAGPIACREAKALVARVSGLDPERAAALDAENARLIARLRASPEGQAGIAAFLARQPPPWLC
ncbi:MAG: enoyl-CoA hydratase-related protein [Xanthomonadales bacterium]|nr:enoyl-CoA hydratase-related protein [Xanthomonadales bacterium]